MSLLEFRDVRKSYSQGEQRVDALAGVSLRIETTDFVSISGPSGSGKSTFLNIAGGLDAPDAGSVQILGEDIYSLSDSARARFRLTRLGFVFQSFNLIQVLSAQENVEFILELQGVDKEERRSLSRNILDRVGLRGMEHRRPSQLSGGQQQRVAVARAVASRPPVVFADEPTANLDSKTSQSLIELMKELHRSEGIAFIFATHDPLVMESAERLVEIRDGNFASDSRSSQSQQSSMEEPA